MTQSDIADRLDDLEAQLENQQETIERQQERIDQQAEIIEQQQARLEEQDAIIQSQRERLDDETTPATESEPAEPETADDNSEGPGPIATRRGVLTSAGLLGLLGLGAGTASADASGQIGTSNDPLQDLYTAQLNGSSSGLTVTTNDNGNLTLDPGGTSELTLSNQSTTSSDDNLLAIDSSGNVQKASSTTLNDAGGGSAAWGDGDTDDLLEPSDGNKTGVEGINEIRANGSLTVNIDANDDENFASFAVQQDKDGTSATPFEVLEGGPIIFRENLQLTAGNQINFGSNAQDQTLIDLPIGAALSAGTDHSYAMQIAGTDFLTVYAENDGNGNLQNEAIKANRKIDLQGNNLNNVASIDNGGSAISVNDPVNLSNNDSIQASGTDHLQFDGSGTVTVPNGNLDVQSGTVENTTGAFTLSTGSGDLSLQPAGNIDVNSNRISNAKEIHSDSNNITFKGTADVNLDGTRLTEKGGDMNIVSVNSVNIDIDNDNNDADGNRDFNVTKDGGATKLFTVNDGGDVNVHNGNLDVQGGTVENSTGDLILSSSGDVQVQPSTATNYTIEGAQTGSMDKDPTSTAPDGYVQIDVGGTTRQIPFYNAVSPS